MISTVGYNFTQKWLVKMSTMGYNFTQKRLVSDFFLH